MRDLVLNHASVDPPDALTALKWIRALAVGMGRLAAKGVANRVLHTEGALYGLRCKDGKVIHDPHKALRSIGARDEAIRLKHFQTRFPNKGIQSEDLAERFAATQAIRCGPVSLSNEQAELLLLCIFINGIAVSFPSNEVWQQSRLAIDIAELHDHGNLEEHTEEIDNLSSTDHVDPIVDRHRAALRDCASYQEMWESRKALFPHLHFGQDVKRQLDSLDASSLTTVISRLTALDEAAAEWTNVGGAAPNWRSKVTPESKTVKQSPKLSGRRSFASTSGEKELFLWHDRFPNNGRIHFRVDASLRMVEIGYIGRHLSTKKY